ncbi:MAG TPA: hypothetical protein PLI77_02010 [Bacteroidales bacterium]|nr:hypothetical protein [Bacteroidales bacterium]
MKKLLYFLTFSSLMLPFISCDKDEDIYQTKQKIYKIWEVSEVGDPDQTFEYDKKDLLTSIDDYNETDSTHYFYKFSYNKDKTVDKIEHSSPLYTETVQLYYMNKLVRRMTYTMDGATRMELVFSRDAETNKITKIFEYYDVDYFTGFDKVSKAPLYNKMIGMNETIRELIKKNGVKSLTLHCERTIQYSGNNIVAVDEVYPEYSTKITQALTYDTLSFNPFYGLPYVYKGLLGYSENNRLASYSVSYLNDNVVGDLNTNYQYFLDEKSFPRRIITRQSPDYIPRNTYILYQLP